MLKRNKDNLILNMTFNHALAIIEFSELLQSKRKYVIADQIMRSGCGIGANVKKAQNAESKADFIHKMKLAAKELMKMNTGLCYVSAQKTIP